MKTSLSSLHHQVNDWLRELEFYKEEIAVLSNRLEEVAAKNTSGDVLKKVEQFQNKFIMLREQIDVLNHDVKMREKEVESITKDKPEHIDEKFSMQKDNVHNGMKDFAHSISDTRFEFNRFLAKVL